MASIKLQGDTSGELTISAPAVAGTNTLTLPASSGTLATTADIPAGGKILQVVSTTSTTTFSTTSGTLQNTGVNLAITPTLATSKVLVMVTASLGGSDSYTAMGLRRDATDIATDVDVSSRRGASTGVGPTLANGVYSASVTYLDSPATTSVTTYRITLSARDNVTTTAYLNRSLNDSDIAHTIRPTSTITLMEIGV
jgi:hypothetical protein